MLKVRLFVLEALLRFLLPLQLKLQFGPGDSIFCGTPFLVGAMKQGRWGNPVDARLSLERTVSFPMLKPQSATILPLSEGI